ncbi:MAG: NAD(P)/FAD-dependent oxidoreductase [Treponema sp.]|jgi:glycerol-3-phosphate dehydrogenase|nr:NAD(P)/FAD-dependent oxidoreductase [Treponema sp.]
MTGAAETSPSIRYLKPFLGRYDAAIIGAGICGAAAAYELSRYKLSVVVLERENDPAMGTTRANTGIIHAGYDPPPGSLMARLNVEGAALAPELCRKLDVPSRRTGSLVLAFTAEDERRIRALYDRGQRNGAAALELLSGPQTLALERRINPAVRGALRARNALVVNPWEYALALLETALRNGVELLLSAEALSVERDPDESGGRWRIATRRGIIESRFVINAAGLQSDRVHNMAAPPAFTIKSGRGAYYLLDKSEGDTVGHIIFQCPSETGKGVTVTPTVHGNLLAGPNFESPPEREDVSTTACGLEEIARKVRLSVPDINLAASIRSFAGNRASAAGISSGPAGPVETGGMAMIEDFIITEAAPRFFDCAGIKSPGLSSAPAIARYLVTLLEKAGLPLEAKPAAAFIDSRRRLRFAELPPEERAALVRKNPAWGRVICRCETITEGEILAAFAAPIPPRTLDAVKRRCGPGMGRCQGGFCGPRVLELIARHFGAPPEEVLQDGEGSFVLSGVLSGGFDKKVSE